ncbi:hypothetical protein [Roseiterribacter gracilis]|uniref:Aminopeptidase n=1 Tax=Roseiterribacter gracilis TaxID=2812848 RepID=A0A8S8XB10_9PROT|nr:hypothetical protein TMPK1_07840 [Rhodospirillales bacterium TMPK1]
MRAQLVAAMLLAGLVAGCSTRSISNSGYSESGNGPANPFYRGELARTDVIDVPAESAINDAAIAAALASGGTRLRAGERLLLVQSGATQPDEGLMQLSERFDLAPWSGVPNKDGVGPKRLRWIAAEGGATHLVVIWGTLESAQESGATKVISWVPIVGALIPDQSQRMRIRLDVLIVDTATGKWRVVAVPPVEDETYSARVSRAASDQAQVANLKAKAYASLRAELLRVTDPSR